MFTYVVWACYAYAAVWAVASVLFYVVDRRCSEATESRISIWGLVGLGFVWPGVLVVFIRLLWLAFQSDRADRAGR